MAAIAQRYPLARVLIRAVSEFIIDSAADLGPMFESHERGVIFYALLRGTEAYFREDTEARDLAISINTLAGGLQRPFETVRKQVQRMAAEGWCEVTPRGVMIPVATRQRAEVQAVLDMAHDRLILLIEDLKDIGYPLPPAQPGESGAATNILRRAGIELFLALWEIAAPYHGGPIKALVYGATMVANARPITCDRELSHLYSEADQPPPEETRAPIRTSALAEAVHLPYATARRHVEAQILSGRMVRRRGGVLISEESLQDPGNQGVSAFASARFAVLLRALQSAHFPFDNPGSAYAIGRPQHLDYKLG